MGNEKLETEYLTEPYDLYKTIGSQADAEKVKELLLKLGIDLEQME